MPEHEILYALKNLKVSEISGVGDPAHEIPGWMVQKQEYTPALVPATTKWDELLRDLQDLYSETGWYKNLRSLITRLSDGGLVSLPAAEMEEIKRAAYADMILDLEATQRAQKCRGMLGEFLRSEDASVRKAARDTVVNETLTPDEIARLPAGPARIPPSARPAVKTLHDGSFFRKVDNPRPKFAGMFFR